MPTSEAQLRSNKKHLKEKLDIVTFRVPKGLRERIQSHAVLHGESMNGFILRAVNEAMARDDADITPPEKE